jgi:hypothetical protein
VLQVAQIRAKGQQRCKNFAANLKELRRFSDTSTLVV